MCLQQVLFNLLNTQADPSLIFPISDNIIS